MDAPASADAAASKMNRTDHDSDKVLSLQSRTRSEPRQSLQLLDLHFDILQLIVKEACEGPTRVLFECFDPLNTR
jgi:hypothetical protein